ncbi:hypothetical protein CNR22_21185 [Sphingobacteriaceae bacterium]|nr:hypothetical protein CNR22_21185 [Sphingobacteriaceae bacterium]
MKKQLSKFSTLALALCSFATFAQNHIQPCNTFAAMEQYFAENPQARVEYEAKQVQMQKEHQVYKQTQASKSTNSAPVYSVPVVFHVLYECNGQTISDATLIAALAEVNNDYARNSADTNLIVNPFKTSYINSDIKLMLAKKDPNGNCINGIVRHENSKTHWNQGTANSGSFAGNAYWEYTWDPTKYLNVYIVAEIIPQGTVTGGGTIVGYTYRPGTWGTGNAHDAIVYDMDFLGGNNGNVPKSRSLSHEIGHWFNLNHTFGGSNNPGLSCNTNDDIDDTPITKGEFGGCANSLIATCTQTNPAMNGLNNVQNIMNYSDCPRNFTTDQTAWMRSALGSNISGRSNLSTPSTLAFTDVNGSGLCPARAELYPTNCATIVCKGGSLSFKDFSSNGVITSLTWSADNGATVVSPNASVTSINFPNAGLTNITLTASTAQGSDVVTKSVNVVDNPIGFGPVSMESFENPGVPQDWAVVDGSSDGVTWEQTTASAYDGAASFKINGSNNPNGQSDILQMPRMDVLNNQNGVLTFAYAYRQYASSYNDILRIEGSKDCGGTWSTIYSLTGASMQSGSGGISTDEFIPTLEEWKTYTVSAHPNWQSYKSSSNVLVRFNYITGSQPFGGNIFLDVVSFVSVTNPTTGVGINELTKSVSLALYPNPTTGEANLSFKLQDASPIKMTVVDVMGREVVPSVETTLSAGEQVLTVNKGATLSKGVYFVNLSVNGAKMSKKLVIN